MDKQIHKGHRSRIRQRVISEGLDNFQDYQVLEYALSFVIPYKDTNPIAHNLINTFGSLRAVLEANEEDLANVKGMGEVSAHFLTSIIKIYNFYEKEKINTMGKIVTPNEAYQYVRKYFAGKLREELYLVCLLPNNKIFKTEKVAEGTTGQAKVAIRQITDMISRNKVNNIVIAHNHPNGTAVPSIDDDTFTKALVTSLALNDCYMLDHIIIGDNDYYSYRESGKIDDYRQEVVYLLTGRDIAQTEAQYTYTIDKQKSNDKSKIDLFDYNAHIDISEVDYDQE